MTTDATMTVLLTSVGRRVELVRLFDQAIAQRGMPVRVIGTEIDITAPAAQALGPERTRIVSRVQDPSYPAEIARIIQDEGVSLVLPLIDPDVERLAGEDGRVEGTDAIFGSVARRHVDVVSDKWKTFEFLTLHEIPTPSTHIPNEYRWSGEDVIIKPRNGSASRDVYRARNRAEFEFFSNYVSGAVVQQCLAGPEVTIDMIVGRDRRILAVAQRERISVRGGEVSRGITIDSPEIYDIAMRVAAALNPYGPITVQGMWGKSGFMVTEVNARLGGGLPLAVAAGVPVAELLLESWLGLSQRPGETARATAGVLMSRYDASFFTRA